MTKDYTDGAQFVELFPKESFNIETLQKFCLSKTDELHQKQKIKEETGGRVIGASALL